MSVIITINDESAFQDDPGLHYEYGRKRAVDALQPGTRVIFYTGGRRSEVNKPRVSPLSNHPHYFAFGIVGTVQVPNVAGGLYSCTFSEYSPFARAVPLKLKGPTEKYLEPVERVKTRRSYFQNGVRVVDEAVFEDILRLAGASFDPVLRDGEQSPSIEAKEEGGRTMVIASRIERDRSLRAKAIEIHGLTCKACKFNFGRTYGSYAEGYIHVHHLKPLGSSNDRRLVNPEHDLTVLCANCHCIVHRRRDQLLSIEDLKAMIEAAKASQPGKG